MRVEQTLFESAKKFIVYGKPQDYVPHAKTFGNKAVYPLKLVNLLAYFRNINCCA